MIEKKIRTFGMSTRPYEYSDFEAVRSLYLEVWKDQRGFDYDRIRLRDTYDGLPVASVGTFAGEIGGFFTIWPMRLTDGKKSVSGGQAMDVMTSERFRGKGVFPTLATQASIDALNRGIKILFGVPNEAVYETYIKRLSWASPSKVHTCVRPLSVKRKYPALGLLDSVISIFPGAHTSGFSISDTMPSEDFVDKCLASQAKSRGVWQVEKSSDWYSFRYQRNEKFDYFWVYASSVDKGNAFAIWGVDKISIGGLLRSNLLDVVGDTDAACRAVVSGTVKRASNSGASYIAATTTSKRRLKWMLKSSFFRVKSSPLIVKTLDPSPFNANPFQEDSWDLFGGDFDFA